MDDLQAICDAALAGYGIAWLPADGRENSRKLIPLLKQAQTYASTFMQSGNRRRICHSEPNCHRYACPAVLPSVLSLDMPSPKKAALNARPEVVLYNND